ncbi:aldo/keto reductase [Muricoccus radiodurans]|uniref:aldo/keto reductase n=1 Tax=Muricoccus radiodurans TaxID=2231721 RepID=UPI003CF859B8
MSDTITTPQITLPRLGLGTFRLDGPAGQAAVERALRLGYRALDTAERYENEEVVGAGLKASGVARADVKVTSKVWWDHLGPGQIRAACEASLGRLGTDYLDLYLVHWPAPGMDLPRVLADMARLKEEGLVRAIGVANFPANLLRRALAVGVPLAANQVEYHLMLSQNRLLAVTRPAGMILTAYTPLGKGKLASDPTVQAIAARHGATGGQVALAWLLRQDGVAAIPKAAREESQRENLGAVALAPKLTAEDVAALDALPKDQRMVNPDFRPDWND